MLISYNNYAGKRSEKIKEPLKKAEKLIEIENAFGLWMDTFPSDVPDELLQYRESHDKGLDYIGLHPLNDPEYPMTPEEKTEHNKRAKDLFNRSISKYKLIYAVTRYF